MHVIDVDGITCTMHDALDDINFPAVAVRWHEGQLEAAASESADEVTIHWLIMQEWARGASDADTTEWVVHVPEDVSTDDAHRVRETLDAL